MDARPPGVSHIEEIAALLGLANILLVVRRSIWNYPFGIAMVLLYGKVFLDARLYSDAALQLFFLVLNLWGWWNWAQHREQGAVVVETLSPRARALWAGGLAIAIAAWGAAERRWLPGASYPFGDAAVAALSIAAQALQSARRLESWVLWIVVDMLSVALYWSKGLEATTALYLVFLVMAVWGLIEWRRALGAASGRA